MMEEKQCKQRIYGSRVSSWSCTRPAGYGPNGDYCKVHGRLNEKAPSEKSLWRVSRFQSSPFPVEVKVRKIGEKTFIDGNGSRCRYHTEYDEFFLTELDGIAFMLEKAERTKKNAEKELAASERDIHALAERKMVLKGRE